MLAFAQKLKEHTGSPLTLTATTDRTEALPGADYVVTSVARQRMPLWEQDYRVPRAHGVRHILGENGGPGAVFHALRSLDLIVPIARDVERLCPDALVLNFTNPEARVLHAILRLTKVRAVGLCHGVFSLERLVCDLTRIPAEHLVLTSAGMNHAYCALSIIDQRTGEERLPEVLKMVQEDESLAVPPLFREFARLFDVVTFPSDDHVGEYFSFGAEFHDGRWPYGQESRQVTDAAPGVNEVEAFLRGEVPVEQAGRPSGESAVSLICQLQEAEPARFSAVNVGNEGPLIDNLPEDAVVEVPAMVNRDGIKPIAVGPIPEVFAVALRTQCAIISTVTEAYRTRSRKLLLQALLLDPCVNGLAQAKNILDDMLRLQAEYLPSFE
jgi:alpha-galactosidase